MFPLFSYKLPKKLKTNKKTQMNSTLEQVLKKRIKETEGPRVQLGHSRKINLKREGKAGTRGGKNCLLMKV